MVTYSLMHRHPLLHMSAGLAANEMITSVKCYGLVQQQNSLQETACSATLGHIAKGHTGVDVDEGAALLGAHGICSLVVLQARLHLSSPVGQGVEVQKVTGMPWVPSLLDRLA